jgi:hypothetical protein
MADSPTSRRSWLRPTLVQFREPNNAAEPSADEGSERPLRFDHPSLCYHCKLPHETLYERNQRRMVSAIALTHMASCGSFMIAQIIKIWIEMWINPEVLSTPCECCQRRLTVKVSARKDISLQKSGTTSCSTTSAMDGHGGYVLDWVASASTSVEACLLSLSNIFLNTHRASSKP